MKLGLVGLLALLVGAAFGQSMALPFLGHRPTVCIDPGHPSEVGIGTQGKYVTEVGLAWQVSQLLATKLRKLGIAVCLTKSREREMVTNRRRAEIGNRALADLVLRLHCDAGTGSGLTTYYPSHPAEVEGHTGPSETVIAASGEAARVFHGAVSRSLDGFLTENGVKTDRDTYIGKKQGALTGSVFSQRPVILVEMCVLQNADDEAKVRTPAGRERLAKGLLAGVRAVLKR